MYMCIATITSGGKNAMCELQIGHLSINEVVERARHTRAGVHSFQTTYCFTAETNAAVHMGHFFGDNACAQFSHNAK
jgi:hypothetical protein